MRKYLLLATVAGCMFSFGAKAGSIATNKQSAIINVYANVQLAAEITSIQDMNFGTISVLSGTTGDLVSMSTEGNREAISSGVVGISGDSTPGGMDDNAGGVNYLTITCADGTGDPTASDVCDLGNGLALKNVVSTGGGGSGYYRFGGTLTATSAITEPKTINAAGIKVSIDY